MTSLPTLFVSHGAPTFALQPGCAGPALSALGRRLPRPRAILVVSPHWLSRSVDITGAAQPETIHDFGGFEQRLYELQYPAPGAPTLAGEISTRLRVAGYASQIQPTRGLDHGVWVPLRYLFPAADVPVLQLALQPQQAPRYYYELGRTLAVLANEGVLTVGSGSITHNLYDYRPGQAAAAYVLEFIAWLRNTLARGDLDALLDYRRQAPHAARAHPTDEHLMPFYIALGAADDWTQNLCIDGGVTDAALGMDGFVFGSASNALRIAPKQAASEVSDVTV